MRVAVGMATIVSLLACGQDAIKPNESEAPARETGNGGDPVETLFSEQRKYAALAIMELTPEQIELLPDSSLRSWLAKNQKALAADVEQSPHDWSAKKATTCAETERELASPIRFSGPTCRESVPLLAPKMAQKILIHESTHHLGIVTEDKAIKIAEAVVDHIDPLVGKWSCSYRGARYTDPQYFFEGGALNDTLFACLVHSWERQGNQLLIHTRNCSTTVYSLEFSGASKLRIYNDRYTYKCTRMKS